MQGRDNEGERLLREALKLSPQNAEVYHALGLLLVRKKQMSEAIDALEKSVRLKPDNPHYSYVYAVALNTIGKSAEAIEVLKKTNTRHPNDREVLYALVYFNRDRGNINAARQYAEKLIELSPSDSDAHRLLDELK
jgi:Flp pilus assembly protein TadD